VLLFHPGPGRRDDEVALLAALVANDVVTVSAAVEGQVIQLG
jgi:hypothetical protein